MYHFKHLILGAFTFSIIPFAEAQTPTHQPGKVVSAVPFLTITPDARSAGMADCGTATFADVNSIHFNPAKYAFAEKKGAFGISYVPWQRTTAPDLSLTFISLYGRIDSVSTAAMSLRYFAFGFGNWTPDGSQKVNELSIDGAYARKVNSKFSVGLALRFIHSNLVPDMPSLKSITNKAGVSGACDISGYYNDVIKISGHKTTYAFGLNLQNIGTKLTYTDAQHKEFIPTSLHVGASANMDFGHHHSFMITGEVSKLLVPTQPYYLKNSFGDDSLDMQNNLIIQSGKNPNVGAVKGMYQSFYDAPGGFNEELKEYIISIGAEYGYNKRLTFRTGIVHEAIIKGERQYLTFGTGLHFTHFGIDVSYLLTLNRQNPLQNTFHFSLLFGFDSLKKSK